MATAAPLPLSLANWQVFWTERRPFIRWKEEVTTAQKESTQSDDHAPASSCDKYSTFLSRDRGRYRGSKNSVIDHLHSYPSQRSPIHHTSSVEFSLPLCDRV